MHASSMIRRSVLKVQITVNITILPGPVSPERRLVATTPNMIATPTDTITANTPAMVDALNISERAKDLSTESSLMTSVLSPRTQTIARNCAAEMTADAVPTAEASTMCAANEPEEKPEATGDDSGAIQGSRVLDDWPFDESSDLMHQLLIVGSKERATRVATRASSLLHHDVALGCGSPGWSKSHVRSNACVEAIPPHPAASSQPDGCPAARSAPTIAPRLQRLLTPASPGEKR